MPVTIRKASISEDEQTVDESVLDDEEEQTVIDDVGDLSPSCRGIRRTVNPRNQNVSNKDQVEVQVEKKLPWNRNVRSAASVKKKHTEEEAQTFLDNAIKTSKLFSMLHSTNNTKALKTGCISVVGTSLDFWKQLYEYDMKTHSTSTNNIQVLVNGREVLNQTL